jgi:hypothetical protein
MARLLLSVLAAFSLVVSCAGPAAGQSIKAQKPVMMIGDVFQFNEGSWATYTLHDKKEDTYYSMTMSILESVRRNGKDCAWMEVEIETEKELVVTRFLTEKTKTGPGDLLAAIVGVYGMEPFSIPQKMMKDANKQVPPLQVGHVVKRVEQKRLSFDGESLDVWSVEAADPKGAPISAMVSLGVAPIGVVMADTDEISMYLEAWGGDARTHITGTPMGFMEWILSQVGKGMAGQEIGMKERPQRAWDVAGMWREFEGPCAGGSWAVTARIDGQSRVTVPRCEGAPRVLVSEGTAPRWRSDRVVVLTGPGGAGSATSTLIFVAPSRAVVWYTTADGRPVFATLRK